MSVSWVLEQSTGAPGSRGQVPSGRQKGRASPLLVRLAAWPPGREVLLLKADLGSSSLATRVRTHFPETLDFIRTDRQFWAACNSSSV